MASSSSSNTVEKILKRANPTTIQDKFLVGYQGWFTCPGDGEPVGPGHHGWLHWFNYPIPDGGRPNTDVWPDVSACSPSELFPAPGLKSKTGEPVFLFSSRNAKTVQRHFRWMAEHGVDGAFLQRFAGQCDMEQGNEGIRRIRDEVGDRVREAAEKEGRVYAIMYDVSGVPADRIRKVLEQDWVHLIRQKGILDSPNYLKEKGKPVVALWGFGFDNAGHTPELVHSVTQFFRNTTPGGVYIMGGTPAHWRTAQGDADRNPAFLNVWLNDFDAISPWTIGRYGNERDADRFYEEKMTGDSEMIKKHNEEKGTRVDYIPVVYPGGSGFNLSEGKWGFNDIKRNGGRFLWKQISNAKRLGVRTVYGAMWDEYDEGTAFMPIVEHKRLLPESDKYHFMALDEDGYDLPSDWYMRICGFAAEALRSERLVHETFPVKELQDYYSSRPRYEEVDVSRKGEFISGSVVTNASTSETGDNSQGGQTYVEWLAGQKEEKEEPPPPPYTLEADEGVAGASSGPAPTPTVADARRGSIPPSAAVSSGLAQGHSPSQLQQHNIPDVAGSHPHSPTQVMHNTGEGSQPMSSNGNYPGPASTPHPGLGNTTSQPQQSYPPPSAYGPPPNIQHPPPPQQQQQDPVSTLTYDFERQNLSSTSSPPPQPNVDLGRRPSAAASISSPLVHSAHPPTGPGATSGHPSRPTSGQSNHGQSHYHYPQQQQQPPSSQLAPRPSFSTRPISYQNQTGPQPLQQPIGGASSSQWPPPEWGVGPSSIGPSSSSTPTATAPHSTYPSNVGGANLSRPQSFSASTVAGASAAAGANLRPHSSVSARPSAASSYTSTPPTAISAPYTPYNPNSSAYAPPRPTSSQSHGYSSSYGHSPTHANFPSAGPPPPSSYTPHPPPVSSYPGSNQGSYNNPSYTAPAPWGGAPPPPHASPPRSPTTFPDQPSYSPYSYNPSVLPPSHNQTSSTLYPHGPRTSPPPSNMMPSSEGLYFPQAEDTYYGDNGGNNMSMPGAAPYGSSSYSNPYGGPSSSYSYPQAHPATPPLDAHSSGPWVPSTNTGSAPALPPRPPMHASMNSGHASYSSYGGSGGGSGSSTSNSGSKMSGAFGLALSAVDKVAGKKTREQLESQVESLAQTGTKLFGKYMK